MIPGRHPQFIDAKLRRECRLPDGRVGYVQNVTRRSRIATVVIAGRRIRIPTVDVAVFSTHLAPGPDGVLPCCFHLQSEMPADHRLTSNPARATCPGWITYGR